MRSFVAARIASAIGLGSGAFAPLLACDVCAVYTATEMRESRVGPWAGVAQQFSRFTTLQEGGEEVGNPSNERMESSITQVLVGYTVAPELTLQVNVPLVHRSFRRSSGSGIDRGSESGIGDVTLLGRYDFWSYVSEKSLFRIAAFGGLELPTGDSDRLGEESGAGHHGAGEEEEHDHAHSGVHGHDLTLGSGSVDGVLGARAFASHERLFATAVVQYVIRTEGDFHYDFANELSWSGGPGVILLADHARLLGLQAVLAGETKGTDRQDDRIVEDSAITALYVGPGLLFTAGASLGGELVADLPVVQNNSALQIVPDWRIRGGVSWRF